jgi:hypothetical protein
MTVDAPGRRSMQLATARSLCIDRRTPGQAKPRWRAWVVGRVGPHPPDEPNPRRNKRSEMSTKELKKFIDWGQVDWSVPTSGESDPKWFSADACTKEIAENCIHGYFISGDGIAPSWAVSRYTDRVVAYHGFDGTWVGWDQGKPIIKLQYSEISSFLDGVDEILK